MIKRLLVTLAVVFLLLFVFALIFYPIPSANLENRVSQYINKEPRQMLRIQDRQETACRMFYLIKGQDQSYFLLMCDKAFLFPIFSRYRIVQLIPLEDVDAWETKYLTEKISLSFQNGRLTIQAVRYLPFSIILLWLYLLQTIVHALKRGKRKAE